jgi:hypothetical protein
MNRLFRAQTLGMTVTQASRIVVFLVLPLASGAAVLAGQRRNVVPVGWKGHAFLYSPLIGAESSLAVFAGVVTASALAGH